MNEAPYLNTTNTDAWRDLMCRNRCMNLAVLLIDDDPYCLDCAEDQFEYDVACSENKSLRWQLDPPHLRG